MSLSNATAHVSESFVSAAGQIKTGAIAKEKLLIPVVRVYACASILYCYRSESYVSFQLVQPSPQNNDT